VLEAVRLLKEAAQSEGESLAVDAETQALRQWPGFLQFILSREESVDLATYRMMIFLSLDSGVLAEIHGVRGQVKHGRYCF